MGLIRLIKTGKVVVLTKIGKESLIKGKGTPVEFDCIIKEDDGFRLIFFLIS